MGLYCALRGVWCYFSSWVSSLNLLTVDVDQEPLLLPPGCPVPFELCGSEQECTGKVTVGKVLISDSLETCSGLSSCSPAFGSPSMAWDLYRENFCLCLIDIVKAPFSSEAVALLSH